MQRQTIDEYLDGILDAAARSELERAILQDPTAAQLLSQMKAERALRGAVYSSYTPTAAHASALATQTLRLCADDAAATAGRILPSSVRWGSAIAAGLALVIGAFSAGRFTAPAQTVDRPVVQTVESHTVALVNESGVPQEERQFSSVDARNTFMAELNQRGVSARDADNNLAVLASLDYTQKPGKF
jgi:anti-sigma factor RsiW